jgi:regulation of enolase protein 1 (concanavalin A-like superfamily)
MYDLPKNGLNKVIKRARKMKKSITLNNFNWINKPAGFSIDGNKLTIEPDTGTDLWQRTYYGFRNDNAPMFLTGIQGDFTFTVKAAFNYQNQYDQCGIVLYENSENWVKTSVEYENEIFARLGSVVTNSGYSDWATTDISAGIQEMWFRISRRGQDFYIEYSVYGEQFKQIRVLHFHLPISAAQIGVYACSPVKSGFRSTFSEFKFEPCKWEVHNS